MLLSPRLFFLFPTIGCKVYCFLSHLCFLLRFSFFITSFRYNRFSKIIPIVIYKWHTIDFIFVFLYIFKQNLIYVANIQNACEECVYFYFLTFSNRNFIAKFRIESIFIYASVANAACQFAIEKMRSANATLNSFLKIAATQRALIKFFRRAVIKPEFFYKNVFKSFFDSSFYPELCQKSMCSFIV